MTFHDLSQSLHALDGQSYGAYKQIKGVYRSERLQLLIDYVQGDPFARPSRLRARLEPHWADLPAWAYASADRRRATADYLNRRLGSRFADAPGIRGSGRSGELRVLRPGQQVLERTSLLISATGAVEARFGVGLPANGRRILGAEAARLLCEILPPVLIGALVLDSAGRAALRAHVETVEDAVALRAQLEGTGLIAFVADGAILPRRSGVDDRPLDEGAIAFTAPPSLRMSLDRPNRGTIRGMGIPEGVTLIVGGGYHGKSTLLRAIETGVYDHIPGDGREAVVTRADAVKVRAEDGRGVAGVDISNFIGGLPSGADTRSFTTTNASGSTSQATAICEALETGCRLLLVDEDTSATNFLIRDGRMQALIPDEAEPITPFLDRARQLHRELGVSTVLVLGGSGDYFDVADLVLAMAAYQPQNRTEDAHAITGALPASRTPEGGPWRALRPHAPQPGSIDARRGHRQKHVRTSGLTLLEFGTERLQVDAVEQLVEEAQLEAIAAALLRARDEHIDGERTSAQALRSLMQEIAQEGLGVVHPDPIGDFASFRIHELAAVMGRLRSLRVAPVED